MARVRIEEPALRSWDDVNLNLKEIGECQLAIEAIEADMNSKIQDLKLDAELKAQAHKERIKRLEREIKEYVEANRTDLKGKTRQLNFGQVGFRRSTKIILRNVKAALQALKGRGMTDCIIVKETVSKDNLKGYPDEVIASVGATKKVEDVFWYEVDREKLRD